MRARRNIIDLEEDAGSDMYGNKTKKDAFELGAGNDDIFGAGIDDLMKADLGYKRMENGMGLNGNAQDMKKQN